MAMIGVLNIFDNQKETWDQYNERLEAYFKANKIEDIEVKKAILQTVLSPETYSLLRNRIRPAEVKDKSFNELVVALKQYFNPTPQRSIARLRFHRRTRKPAEAIEDYIADLQTLASSCAYDKRDEMIVDQIIFGINGDAMQQRLISEEAEKKTITLERATAILVAMESSARNLGEMKAEDKTAQINKINSKYVRPENSNRANKGRASHTNFNNNSGTRTHNQNQKDSNGTTIINPKGCYRCKSKEHYANECQYVNAKCNKCARTGHIAPACRNPPGKTKPQPGRKKPDRTNHVGEHSTDIDEYDVDVYHIENPLATNGTNKPRMIPDSTQVNSVRNPIMAHDDVPPPDLINLEINGVPLVFEVDSGSGYTMLKENDFLTLPRETKILPFTRKLQSYTGDEVHVIGQASVIVTHGSLQSELPLLIVKGTKPNLCGRKWIHSELNILSSIAKTETINSIRSGDAELDAILDKRGNLFTPGLGKLKNIKAHLHLKKVITPKFCKARTVPYARKEAVENELRRMVKEGILEKVDYSDFASPIVSVQKPNGGIRICADFKTTLNPQLNVDKYPLPRTEDVFSKLAGCVYFSTLDLREAYNQIELDEVSRKYTVINTSLGLFQFSRLPFGVASASAIFQRIMEMILADVSSVSPFQDDTLVGGRNKSDHLTKLDMVLQKMEEYGLKLRFEKCKFLKTQVEFLGHRLDARGLHPQAKKMKAIVNAPEPTNVETLRSFLGILNYYAKFLPNNASKLAPLYKLLQKNAEWTWGKEQALAFQEAKNTLLTSNILEHYDVNKPISLACDASPVGVGAVISHHVGSQERPIAFASRSLAPAEKNYSQLDKEALAIIFGLKKFKDYLYGKTFTLYTDHQPLVTLLGANKPSPPMAAARLQRWALLMASYSYKLVFRKGSANANADALSRSPLPIQTTSVAAPAEYVFLIKEVSSNGPLTPKKLEEATHTDPVLQRLWKFMTNGWPRKDIPSDLKTFHRRRNDISNFNGVLLMGNRAIIPETKRNLILQDLHSSHQGVVKMKAVARSRFWWPNIDEDIEQLAGTCHSCRAHAPLPNSNYQSWPKTKKPWERVHADFAGPVEGRYLLIVVGSFSKWIEVKITKTQSSQAVISFLRELIALYGIMFTLVTDNGTCFTSSEFAEFIDNNGISHLRTAPHHPASNGAAERGVRTIKDKLKKVTYQPNEAGTIIYAGLSTHPSGPLEERVARILMAYRRSPTSSGKSPAELMIGRTIISRLDLCHPKIAPQALDSPIKDSTKPKFNIHNKVYARNFGTGEKWIPGTVLSTSGRMMYNIHTAKGEIRRHHNQLRSRVEENKPIINSTLQTTDPYIAHYTSSSDTLTINDSLSRQHLTNPAVTPASNLNPQSIDPDPEPPTVQAGVASPPRSDIPSRGTTSIRATQESEKSDFTALMRPRREKKLYITH